MSPAPTADRPAPAIGFILWLAGGVGLVVLSWVLIEDYYQNYWTQSVFVPVNPTPEYRSWRLYYEAVGLLPWFSLGYGLLGAYAFRRRGGLAVACAAAFTCCPFLAQLGNGLGRL